ncbi:MAG: ABC transporter permease [Caldilineaceae bacterium]|nr:ABC transporter permease [Caldilineaceae bacterium]
MAEEHAISDSEERIFVAGQMQLMWWRFRKHRVAVVATFVVVAFYVVVLAADFLAYTDPNTTEAYRLLMPPQPIRFFDNGSFRPHVYAVSGKRDLRTFKRVYEADPNNKLTVRFFARGYKYKLFGFIRTDRHLIGVEGATAAESLFLLGTDEKGRDVWSRMMVATRTSLTIGLVAVALSLVLGVLLGGISGFYGGAIDSIIQRLIEILRSIPTIPLWMGMAAAFPREWSVEQIYFAITIVIALRGWTGLAREVRGRFLSLREEDFVTAADLAGCSRKRIIFRHMIPSFQSHIIAAATLSIPAMILAETALSYLGLGLRPPAISWGVMLQQVQNVEAVALSPWLLVSAVPVIVVTLAFNFMGDGLRDAADPYGI